MSLAVGTKLGRYEIRSKIGEGGMGEVYLAQDTKLDRKVALKILPADVASNRDRMERFVREAKSAATLNHPNIAHIYEIGESDGTHYIAMEFIDGDTLRHKIHRDKTPLSKLLKYLIQVAQGLSKAHAAGIVHRDLKPDNIMITRDDYAKVLDFGLAKLVEPQRTFGSNESGSSDIATAVMQQPGPAGRLSSWDSGHSAPGMVIGTIGYMSPEQASGRVDEIDLRSDIFSFGCILFEAATGQRAFAGKDVLDSLHKIVHAPTPQLKDANPLAPAELQRVVRRCLAKEREKRYQSIKELVIELDDLQQELAGLAESEYSGHPAPATSASTSEMTRGEEGFRIAVLPFKVRDADPGVDVLADGLSEEIVTGLSRFRYLSVVRSTSAVRLKGETVDEGSLAAKLGTRYVFEGSIRKGGSAIRVSAQLVDTETGAQLWSETYNRDLQTSTIFDVQDDIAGRIVATVADSYGVLVHSMRAAIRKKEDADLTPVEWQFQYFAYREQITPVAHAALKSRLERAAKRDEWQSDLWACLAQIYVDEYAFGFQDDATSLDRALAAGRRAVELDRSNQFALVALAQVHFFRRDLAAFGPAAERAMTLNPLNTDALGILGLQIVHTGEFERGTAIVRRAMELNPNHAGWMHFAPLWDHFHKGEYERALECANRVDVPGLFWPFLVMASACGHLGRRAEAEAAVRDLLALDPEFAAHARSNVGTWHFASGLMGPILDGLRKAGLEIVDEESTSTSSSTHIVSSESRADEGFWVAVLPFKFTGATELATLAEGLSEEVVRGLSRFSYLRVIAPSSTLRYATETSDARAIGKQLGASYLLEGSVRQVGSTVRIALQLVNTVSGAHLWAESYDRAFQPEKIFGLQDELVPRIVSTIADTYGVLPRTMSDALRTKDPEHLTPYEAVLRSFAHFPRLATKEHAAARASLERAVELAPNNADAWAILSMLYRDEYTQGFNVRPDAIGRALDAARRAVEAAPSNHLAYHALASAQFFCREFQAFRNSAERAITLNSNDGFTTAYLGLLVALAGEWERGLELAKRARDLNPHHPGWYWFCFFFDAYRKSDYRAALNFALKINMPSFWRAHVALAIANAQIGELDAARNAVRELLVLRPNFGMVAREELGKWYKADLIEHIVDGLRKAGLEVEDKAPESSSSSALLVSREIRTDEGFSDALATDDKPNFLPTTPSIAVLPFVNISNDQENEYFCDGLAEELLNALSKIESLHVAARTSAFSFKGKQTDVREIGSTLSVSTVLEGSVRRSGNRVRISVQLVNVADGYHLWSEKYDRQLEDIFDIQDEISLAIVAALKVKLLGAEQKVVKRYTENTEAYQLYLKGRFFVNQRTSESLLKAIDYFNKAIALDANYALGYAGLADAYLVLGVPDAVTEALSPRESLSKARAAAEKALELDTAGGEVYAALAHIKWKERDWAGAESDYKRSIELNPNNPIAHFYYAVCLAGLGRKQQAIKEITRAQELDPLSLPVNASVVYILYLCRKYDEAIEAGKRTLELDAAFPLTHQRLGLPYIQRKMFREAISEFQQAVNNSNRAPQPLVSLAHAYAVSGNNVKAQEVLDELKDLSKERYVSPYGIAIIHVGLEDKEQALQWLERAYDEQNTELTFLSVDPRLDPLRDDPGFQALLKKVSFPQAPEVDGATDTISVNATPKGCRRA